MEYQSARFVADDKLTMGTVWAQLGPLVEGGYSDGATLKMFLVHRV